MMECRELNILDLVYFLYTSMILYIANTLVCTGTHRYIGSFQGIL